MKKLKENYVQVFNSSNGKYGFRIVASGLRLFESGIDSPIMFGDYGFYDSPSGAKSAAKNMILRNRSVILEAQSISGRDEVKSMLIDKYLSQLEFMRGIYRDIVSDSNDDSYNNLQRTVPILNQMISDAADPGKQLDLMIKEMEMSFDGTFPDDTDSPTSEQVDHPYSKRMVSIRDAMRDLKELLSRDFEKFIQAISRNFTKIAGDSKSVLQDLAGDMMAHYAGAACRACKISGAALEDIVEVGGDYMAVVRHDNSRYGIFMGGDLAFRGMIPLSSSCPYTYQNYIKYFRPCLAEIGHAKPMNADGLIVFPVGSEDCYKAFVIGSGEAEAMVKFAGTSTRSKSYSFDVSQIKKEASFSNRMRDTLERNAKHLAESSLVKVTRPDSKYFGMAGEVDTGQISIKNDHVEFPVVLEYDNGFRFSVWFTDDDVEIYLGGE